MQKKINAQYKVDGHKNRINILRTQEGKKQGNSLKK